MWSTEPAASGGKKKELAITTSSCPPPVIYMVPLSWRLNDAGMCIKSKSGSADERQAQPSGLQL